jgi:hypothetical protein
MSWQIAVVSPRFWKRRLNVRETRAHLQGPGADQGLSQGWESQKLAVMPSLISPICYIRVHMHTQCTQPHQYTSRAFPCAERRTHLSSRELLFCFYAPVLPLALKSYARITSYPWFPRAGIQWVLHNCLLDEWMNDRDSSESSVIWLLFLVSWLCKRPPSCCYVRVIAPWGETDKWWLSLENISYSSYDLCSNDLFSLNFSHGRM